MKTSETIIVSPNVKKKLFDTLICSFEIVIFGYFINYSFPYKIIAFVALSHTAFIISRNINHQLISFAQLFKNTFKTRTIIYLFIGIQMGLTAAMYYRGSITMPVLPNLIKPFSIIAVSIGITEELFFRGFIQTQLNRINTYWAILFAAFTHTAYKTSLFISPATIIPHENIPFFMIASFIAFIILGILKQQSKNLLPSIIAHAAFDLVVYAEITQTPWWVW